MLAGNESLDDALRRNVRDAIAEDVGRGDWSARVIPSNMNAHAEVSVKEPIVFCGRAWFESCVMELDPAAVILWNVADGEIAAAGAVLCSVRGAARALASAERAGIHFLQMLSSTATNARTFVRAIEGASPNESGCFILDTRNTLPALRQAQKYAARVGGARNHRLGLWDGILLKKNHILAAGGITAALGSASRLGSGPMVQIEVDSISQLEEALASNASDVLLDNFSLSDMRVAWVINKGRAILEASGTVTLDNVREIAGTGVDRICVSAITNNVRAIDMSLQFVQTFLQ